MGNEANKNNKLNILQDKVVNEDNKDIQIKEDNKQVDVMDYEEEKELDEKEEDLEEEEEEDLEEDSEEDNEDNEDEEELEDMDEEEAPLDKKSLERFKAKIEKSGVVYISRIPPRFKPNKLKTLLSKYNVKIGRVYFAAEDEKARKKRKRLGGSSRKLYTEGWIEFLDKNKAKSLVKLINNTHMDPNKHSFHHEDLWNLKYLSKFKWHHLTERIAYEKEVRSQRLRNEISQAKKLNQQYVDKVEMKKQIEGMESKKKAKQESNDNKTKIVRSFHQREIKSKQSDDKPNKKSKKDDKEDDKLLQDVLSSIF